MRKTEFKTAMEKALTLYEQTQNADFEVVPEDGEYKYVRIPESMDAMLVHHFKLGFEPATDHPANDGLHVVLRIRKERYDEMYAKDAAFLKALLGEQAKRDTEAGMSVSRVDEGRPRSLGEILENLPDTEEDE